MKLSRKIVTVALSTIATLGLSITIGGTTSHAYTQKGYALSTYKAKNFHLVNNHNYYVKKIGTYSRSKTYEATGSFQTTADTYKTIKGNNSATLHTDFYLPVSYHSSGDFASLQSLVVTPNGKKGYVMYLTSHTSNTGWIVKYDLNKLRSVYGASSSNMAILRMASNAYSKGKATAEQRAVLKCLTVGPKFNAGHCQSLSINPKNNQMWFTKTTGKAGAYGSAIRVSLSSLKPISTINFRLRASNGAKISVPNNLAFDKRGYAYFASYASGGTVKFYQGTISSKKVHFKLLMKGLKHQPGATHQGLAYNPKQDRLYMVTDDALVSVPVVKTVKAKLTAGDVKASVFNSKREFESLSFLSNGHGFLLTNRGPEILEATGL